MGLRGKWKERCLLIWAAEQLQAHVPSLPTPPMMPSLCSHYVINPSWVSFSSSFSTLSNPSSRTLFSATTAMSTPSTTISEEASMELSSLMGPQLIPPLSLPPPQPKPKKRSQPGNPDPEAQVIALSPKSLMATNRFVCEICSKGFQRDQNLQLHRRGHNLPWKLGQREGAVRVKRVYVCPEASCVHNHPSRALGDLTGIKKHFFRKHGEKKWKCERCSKKYAVHSDWKAHVKACGNREYRCDCGTLFSRKDSFLTHRDFCDALADESARLNDHQHTLLLPLSSWDPILNPNPSIIHEPNLNNFHAQLHDSLTPQYLHSTTTSTSPHLSATALLQKASTISIIPSGSGGLGLAGFEMGDLMWPQGKRLTKDFLGVAAGETRDEGLLSLTGLGVDMMTSSNYGLSRDTTKPLDAFTFPPFAEQWGDY